MTGTCATLRKWGAGGRLLPLTWSFALAGVLTANPEQAASQTTSLGGDSYPARVTLVPNPQADLTFARDVAPIIQANCERCHRPLSVAPMPLQTYEEVRAFAPLIRDKVVRRAMPPWPVDRTVGVTRFKNDPSLSDEEVRTIVDWIDSGTPMGDPADLPDPVEWPDGRTWEFAAELGEPDMVLQSPLYTVVANGMDQWPTPITPLEEVQIGGEPLTGDRWIRAVAVRPHSAEARYVFHHANPGLIRSPSTRVGHLRS